LGVVGERARRRALLQRQREVVAVRVLGRELVARDQDLEQVVGARAVRGLEELRQRQRVRATLGELAPRELEQLAEGDLAIELEVQRGVALVLAQPEEQVALARRAV